MVKQELFWLITGRMLGSFRRRLSVCPSAVRAPKKFKNVGANRWSDADDGGAILSVLILRLCAYFCSRTRANDVCMCTSPKTACHEGEPCRPKSAGKVHRRSSQEPSLTVVCYGRQLERPTWISACRDPGGPLDPPSEGRLHFVAAICSKWLPLPRTRISAMPMPRVCWKHGTMKCAGDASFTR